MSIKTKAGPSLAVQGLRFCASIQGAQVQSLVGEQKSHVPYRGAKKKKSIKKIFLHINVLSSSISNGLKLEVTQEFIIW